MQQTEIPLCARIMAIADVFDAVSAKRCYRDAMPLEQCFRIIEEGVGQDFDPIIAEVFLDIRPRIEEVYARFQQSNGGVDCVVRVCFFCYFFVSSLAYCRHFLYADGGESVIGRFL